ncbi:methylamine utilization protein MauG [Rhodobacteraceae bacterium ASV31]|nr:methylamine utilization protein MauG [Anianabacter salinae]
MPLRAAVAAAATVCAIEVAADSLPAPLTDTDFNAFDPAQADLGQLLFYDKILSGNRNISCGTCHHHTFGGSDGVSLAIGEGGQGLGPERRVSAGPDLPVERVPRNAPALWNLGHREVSVLFHDGRLTVNPDLPSGFETPAGAKTPLGLSSILAAQALFPVTSATEMAGQGAENPIATVTSQDIAGVWPILEERVRAIPAYADLFAAAFDDVAAPDDITIVHIVNAIAAFIGTEWKNHDSPFDRHLAGNTDALGEDARRGMDLFFGEAACATCHSGPLFTDQSFHALALPAFGPGKVHEPGKAPVDPGRAFKTAQPDDAYRFRTPMLRNVALTAPYGHNGAFETLEGIVRHHANPLASLARWEPQAARLPQVEGLQEVDFAVLEDRPELLRERSTFDIAPVALTRRDVDDLVAFLNALTGETAEALPRGVPERVPSGLPVD